MDISAVPRGQTLHLILVLCLLSFAFSLLGNPAIFSLLLGNKNKIKRIKLVDLKKIKLHSNEDKSIKSVNINCNNLNVNNIDKKYQNKRIEVVEDNNDSFLDELVDLLRNVEVKDNIANTEANSNHNLLNESNEQSEIKINCDLINNNNYMARPQTSYGGLNDRKKKMRRNNVSAQPKMNH